ncbi:hemin ABC transporter substrate-binding protein [Methylobacterium sp. Leaf99]|uniref:heme/hemin ABC transporter substrate-binding protein n=1 Tax=Methylobacterium sp. Leaf99 TaxID=1736251 RepID=UPI0006FE4E11|nr:ABC transporter substrate-binding protein [Methylobacterium sp. Leaf99]KQP10092.1 hemin ABC transporter substrate-binding protein [Methylobacterium sp. Leaf99]
MTALRHLSPSRRAVLAGALGCALAPPARAAAATRIASLGGAVTEILWRLGAGPRIAIVDTTSVYPAEVLRERPNAGYLRALSAEGLLSVGPDLVIAAEGAGPPAVLALLREAGVPVELVREPPTAEGVLDKIATVGRLAGLEAPAADLGRTVADRFAALGRQRARVVRPVRALVVLSQTGGRVMVGGRGSTADGILALAGLVNAADGIEGFKPITDEAIVGAAPDAVIMMTTDGKSPTPEAVFASGTALGQTPAAARRALVAMDGLTLLGFGPRTPEAAGELMRAVYPDLPRD